MKKGYLLFIIIPVSQIMILIGNHVSMGSFGFLGYLGVILSLAADAALGYILYHGIKKEQFEQKLEEISYQRMIEHQRVKRLEEQKDALFSMEKELKERLNCISRELESNNPIKAEQELEKLQDRLEETKPISYCQNRIINVVLDEKKKESKGLGVKWQMELLVPRNLQVEPFHLCSIFANLIDNAIEAVGELEEQERRIRISGKIKGNYLMIKIQNPSTKAHTTRRQREGRGYGTQILKMIAEKYDGTYTSEYQNGIYTVLMAVKGIR